MNIPKWSTRHGLSRVLVITAIVVAVLGSHPITAQTQSSTPTGSIDLIATATAQAAQMLTSIAETQMATLRPAERVATAVAATLTVIAALAPPPTSTPVQAISTPVPPTSTPVPATATPLCTVLVSSLNLRSGPGVNYSPPIGALLQNASLTPLARNATSTWLQVMDAATGRTGWVSAGTQYVRCSMLLTQLPVAQTPPTPTPNPFRPTATPNADQRAPAVGQAAPAGGDRSVTLRAPQNNDGGNGRLNFRWEPNFALPAGTAFEIVFWRDGQDPLTQSKGGVPPSEKTEVGITLDVLYNIGILQSGRNHWGILLVQPESGSQPYRRLAFLRGDYIFNYSPVPTPTPTPTNTPTPKSKK